MRDVLLSLQNQWVELATRMAEEGQLPDGAGCRLWATLG